MKKTLIAANWKMNKTEYWAKKFITEFLPLIEEKEDREIAIAPPFVSLLTVKSLIKDTPITLAAQNMHWELEGAYTGEIAPDMIKEIGCDYVIIGHSERREHFGDTDERIHKKVRCALSSGLKAILCIGEKEFQRESGRTFSVLEYQLRKALGGLNLSKGNDLVVAYEPVWAIGTGKTATPEQADEAHLFIKEQLDQIFSASTASEIRVIYGGSVKADNVDFLMTKEAIEGALVGGASLDPQKFARITNYHIE
jgi:triosephosphate isomerase